MLFDKRLIILFVIVVGLIFYWASLVTTIESQKTEILKLSVAISTQNVAITEATNERNSLQQKINETSLKNVKLSNENNKLKNKITNRPPVNNCEDAFSYLTSTAKQVASEFNNK